MIFEATEVTVAYKKSTIQARLRYSCSCCCCGKHLHMNSAKRKILVFDKYISLKNKDFHTHPIFWEVNKNLKIFQFMWPQSGRILPNRTHINPLQTISFYRHQDMIFPTVWSWKYRKLFYYLAYNHACSIVNNK